MKDINLIPLDEVVLEYFGLRVHPFTNTPNVDLTYESRSFQEGFSALYYVITRKLGFGLITGEVGTGKTQLIRYFMKEPIRGMVIHSAFVLTPLVRPIDLLRMILSDLGVDFKRDSDDPASMVELFYQYTLKKYLMGERVVIFIDEAQDLPFESIEFVRLISNFETSDAKLLDIILVGQPELEEKLSTYELRQLNQRIWVRVRLKPLDIDEIEPYLNMRFEKAGGGRIFDNFIIGELYNFTGGVPRLINAVMERAMLAAFVEDSKIIRPRHVKRAIESLRGEG